MSDKLLEDDVIAYQVTGDYPPGMSGSEFRTRIATLALEALRHRCRYVSRDEIIEWVAGQTKVQHCSPAWCLTDVQIRALKGKDADIRGISK